MEFKRILSLYLLFKIFFFFLVVINNFSYIQNQFDFGRMINQISTFYDLYKYSNFETILVNTNICIFVLFLKSMVFLFIIFVIINLLFNNVNDNINNLLYKIKILLVGIFILITLYFTIIMMFTY
jgi:hypothetical protein